MQQGLLIGLLLLPSTSRGEEQPRDPVVLSVGLDSFVPLEEQGTLETLGIGLATEIQDGSTIGMRISLAMGSIHTSTTPNSERAWAAIIEGRQMLGVGHRADLFLAVAGGFLMGARYEECVSNLVIPHGRLGVGIRLLGQSRTNGNALSLSPELGVVPGVLYGNGPLSVEAYYSAIQLGWVLP